MEGSLRGGPGTIRGWEVAPGHPNEAIFGGRRFTGEGLVARPLAIRTVLAAFAASCLLVLTVVLALAGNAYSAGNLTVPNVPNILFIITDDQELDGTMALMPKTTKWFKDGDPSAGIAGGTEFTEADVTTPLCCPSRSSILSGRYAHNHGVRRNQDAGNLDHNTTLEYYLTQSGYRTGIFGKFLNQWDHTINPPNWTDWSIFSTQKYSGFEVNEQGTLKFNWKYQTNYIGDQADQFLQRTNDDDDSRPWFMYVAATSPHGPYTQTLRFQVSSRTRPTSKAIGRTSPTGYRALWGTRARSRGTGLIT
jgi:hypothetical protein